MLNCVANNAYMYWKLHQYINQPRSESSLIAQDHVPIHAAILWEMHFGEFMAAHWHQRQYDWARSLHHLPLPSGQVTSFPREKSLVRPRVPERVAAHWHDSALRLGALFMYHLGAGRPIVKWLGIRSSRTALPWFPKEENSFKIRTLLREHLTKESSSGESLIQSPLASSLYETATHVK